MKEKKARLKLEDIKVESFITTLNEKISNNEIGGGATRDCSVNVECMTYEFETCMTCDGACHSDWGTCGSNPCC